MAQEVEVGPNHSLRNWCFTCYDLENFKVPDDNQYFRYCIYQGEKCPNTGTIHLQGYVEFTRSMRRKKVQELFGVPNMHVLPRWATREKARNYCRKEDTRWCDPVEFGTWDVEPGKRIDLHKAREIILKKRKRSELYQDEELDQVMTKYPKWAENVLESKAVDFQVDIELYDWQKEVFDLLAAPPVHRRIIWIWSNASNTGKSTFKEYVSTKFDVLPARGRIMDIVYGYDSEQIIWFDYTRAQAGFVSYDTLEELSNHGFKYSTKFQSKKKFIKAHIVVTCNHAPDETKLPQRFKIYCIDNQ